MKEKTVHEPEEELMDADSVWEDAQRLSNLLSQNSQNTEPLIQFQMPLPVFLSILDNFGQDELIAVRKRVDERLAA